jgi:aspartyl-tRNA(Asn)/glutamyl-tRNA(Gln) amidotransferase subunit A
VIRPATPAGEGIVAASLDSIGEAIDRGRHLNAIVAEAAAAEPGDGPLAGLPVAVKDIFFDRGRVPTCGSQVSPRPAGVTHTVALERLRAAGAVVTSYTNLHEWAVGSTSAVTATGPIRNPRDPDRVAGGSSGGSAVAVAAGMAGAAVGTDAGGSVRVPAACCGVVGFKPTHGSIPLAGCALGELAVDHVGPIAGSVATTRALFEVMVERACTELDIEGVRVGVEDPYLWGRADSRVIAAIGDAVDRLVTLGMRAVATTIPNAATGLHAIGPLLLPGIADVVGDDLVNEPERFQPPTLRVLQRAAAMSPAQIVDAAYDGATIREGWDAAFVNADVVVTPTLPVLPPRLDDMKVTVGDETLHADLAFITWNASMNIAGVPSLSLPCADIDGLPVGITITGPRGSDDLVLSIGGALERALDGAFADRVVATG